MNINNNLCVGCGRCVPYCPVGAIEIRKGVARIDRDECVECGTCLRAAECPVGAFSRENLEYPRLLRYIMSDPSSIAPNTSVGGRGTVEMKTNDVTGRFRENEAGIAVEVGRPGIGTKMAQVDMISRALSSIGVSWEPENPITALMSDLKTGEFKKEVLNEKVLSAILEFKVETGKLPAILDMLKTVGKKVDTVFVVSIISKLGANLEDRNLELLSQLGYTTRPNLKVNLGMGKPLFDFGEGKRA